MSPRLADGAGEVVRKSAGVWGGMVLRSGEAKRQAGGCVDGVVAELLEGLRSGMRARREAGQAGLL